MDSYITWPYQIADHYCRITYVYNKKQYLRPDELKVQTCSMTHHLNQLCLVYSWEVISS